MPAVPGSGVPEMVIPELSEVIDRPAGSALLPSASSNLYSLLYPPVAEKLCLNAFPSDAFSTWKAAGSAVSWPAIYSE